MDDNPVERRQLHFDSLESALDEVKTLLKSGYRQNGNWTLGQICRHLRLVQDIHIDGFPRWMSLFAPLRPLLRRFLLPRLLRGDSPKGIRTASIFVPSDQLKDELEVESYGKSIERFLSYSGTLKPHPGFGKLDKAKLEAIHAAHAAHHLGFLSPGSNSE